MRKTILVSVLKSPRDLRTLLQEKWYRIPRAFLPKQKFTHVAFYQPQTTFGKRGKRIQYYARVAKREVKRRVELLPNERAHPRADDDYLKCSFRKIEKLAKPIRNIIPRRVSFGLTSLKALRSARDILQLYGVPPTEQIIERGLRRLNIPFTSQHHLSSSPPQLRRGVRRSGRGGGVLKSYRLDFAIFCKKGNIAIECDNRKAHFSSRQKLKDRRKDAALHRLGWRVIRLTEMDIVEHLNQCMSRVQELVSSLGGSAEERIITTLGLTRLILGNENEIL